MKIAIIGAGLAGCSTAYFLSAAGVECTVFDKAADIASGASGNIAGLYNPRFFAEYNAEAQFYAQAFLSTLDLFEQAGDQINYRPVGALHLMDGEQKKKRFPKMVQNWPWDERLMALVSAEQASDISGVRLEHDALYLPRSGMVSPRLLCAYYMKESGASFQPLLDVSNIDDISADYDAVILTSGYGISLFNQTQDFPIKPVRGQISRVQVDGALSGLKCVLCYGGYTTPVSEGCHIIGSTFDRGVDCCVVKDCDNADNLEKLYGAVPSVQNDAYDVIDARASVRVAAQGHMPIIGKVEDGIYISAAHGSHGILSSLMGAKILTSQIRGGDMPLDDEVLSLLSPARFSC